MKTLEWRSVLMSRRTSLRIYWKLQSIIAPGLQYCQAVYEDTLATHSYQLRRWLDVGCGHQLLPPWRLKHEKALVDKIGLMVGLDYDYLSLTKHSSIAHRLCGDITALPFPDNTFDLITANMVFEHLAKPEEQLREMSRVLSKGGTIILHTPNKSGYVTVLARVIPEVIKARLASVLQGRREEDIFPAYYRANSPSRMRELTKLSNLVLQDVTMVCSSAQCAVFAPIAILELMWIRFLMSNIGRSWRPYIIAVMRKP